MASQLYTITPSSIFGSSADDWHIDGGLNAVNSLASTSATNFLHGTTTEYNTFGFTNVGVTPVNVQWIQYMFSYGSSVANEPMTIRIHIMDGADDSFLYNETINITGPANTAKVQSYYSGIFPYHSGTTAWSATNFDNLKLKAQVYDNSVGNGNVSNKLELHYFEYQVMYNNTDANIRQNISTYSAKKGMSVSKGVVKIG